MVGFKAWETRLNSLFWNYLISLTLQDIDGAYFGTTFPHLFLMTYGHLNPQKPGQSYVPRVFGFKMHKPWDRSFLMALVWVDRSFPSGISLRWQSFNLQWWFSPGLVKCMNGFMSQVMGSCAWYMFKLIRLMIMQFKAIFQENLLLHKFYQCT